MALCGKALIYKNLFLFALYVCCAQLVSSASLPDCSPPPASIANVLARGINVLKEPLQWQENLEPIFDIRPVPEHSDNPFFDENAKKCVELDEVKFSSPESSNEVSSNSVNKFWLPDGFTINVRINSSHVTSYPEQSRLEYSTVTRQKQLINTIPSKIKRYYEERDPILTRAMSDIYNFVQYSRVTEETYVFRVDSSYAPLNSKLLQALKKLATPDMEPPQSDFNQLFDTYGTHLIDLGYLGGDAEILYLFKDVCEGNTSDATSIDRSQYQTVQHFTGGDGQYIADCIGLNLDGLPPSTCVHLKNKWVETLYTNPSLLLHHQLNPRPLYELVHRRDSFTGIEQQTLEKRIDLAMQKYLNKADEVAPCPDDCENGGETLTFYNSQSEQVCQCVCPTGFYKEKCESNLCADPPPVEVPQTAEVSEDNEAVRGAVISCYVCNSANTNSSACEDENINSPEGEKYLKKCTMDQLKQNVQDKIQVEHFDPQQVRCRKLVNTLESTTTVRECAYFIPETAREATKNPQDEKTYCRYRAGTYQVKTSICYCNTDGCNSGQSILITKLLLFITAFIPFLLKNTP